MSHVDRIFDSVPRTTDLTSAIGACLDTAPVYNDRTVTVVLVVVVLGGVDDTSPAGADVSLGRDGGAVKASDGDTPVIPAHFISGDKAT